jgi:hypothetical protein
MTFGIFFSPPAPEPTETKKPVRARAKKGQFQADDPSTPDVNEAWETVESLPEDSKE